jgi:hypothetical protein
MSLGVLGEYGKILLGFFHMRLNICIFSEKLKYFPSIRRRFCVAQTTLTWLYSSCTLKYFPRILTVRRKNGEYAERNYYFQQYLIKLKE